MEQPAPFIRAFIPPLTLVRKYPEAIIILKSQTEKALVNAAQLLKEQCIPMKHIIKAGGLDTFNTHLKDLICEKLTENHSFLTMGN